MEFVAIDIPRSIFGVLDEREKIKQILVMTHLL